MKTYFLILILHLEKAGQFQSSAVNHLLLFSVSCPILEQMFLSWRGRAKRGKQSGSWWDGLTKMSEAHFVWYTTISKLTLNHGENIS